MHNNDERYLWRVDRQNCLHINLYSHTNQINHGETEECWFRQRKMRKLLFTFAVWNARHVHRIALRFHFSAYLCVQIIFEVCSVRTAFHLSRFHFLNFELRFTLFWDLIEYSMSTENWWWLKRRANSTSTLIFSQFWMCEWIEKFNIYSTRIFFLLFSIYFHFGFCHNELPPRLTSHFNHHYHTVYFLFRNLINLIIVLLRLCSKKKKKNSKTKRIDQIMVR